MISDIEFTPLPEPTVSLMVTIQGDIPLFTVPNIVDAFLKAAPAEGRLSIEIDGTNLENRS